MKDAILLVIILFVLVFGFLISGHLDKVVEKSRKTIKKTNEAIEPQCIMLTDQITEEELVSEIRHFREKHLDSRIILCSNTVKYQKVPEDHETEEKYKNY